jgi:tellurite resistance protein TehA-like permease
MTTDSRLNGDAGRQQHRAEVKRARNMLRNFPSQWFLVTQGTGIIAVMLHQLDYQFRGLAIISYVFWVITIVLLLITMVLYCVRATLNPRGLGSALLTSSAELKGLAGISITLTTILMMAALTIALSWKGRWPQAIYGLWWFNVLLALASILLIYFVVWGQARDIFELDSLHLAQDEMRQRKEKPIAGSPRLLSPSYTPSSQLPLIAALTAAGGGATIANYGGLDAGQKAPMIVVSFILIGMALPLALALDTLFLARTLLLLPEGAYQPQASPELGQQNGLTEQTNRPPARVDNSIFQEMIMCGPWGTASFALQALGQAVLHGGLVGTSDGPIVGTAAAGPVGYASMFAGLLTWGAGTFWWAYATLALVSIFMRKKARKRISFGLVEWSVIYPWVSQCCRKRWSCSAVADLETLRVSIRMHASSSANSSTRRPSESGRRRWQSCW